jgi:hypothetical protein
MPLDCSPAEQDRRREMLRDLRAIRYGGAQSLSDRSRSVSYRSAAELVAAINALEREIELCDGTLSRRTLARRIFHPAYSKWL